MCKNTEGGYQCVCKTGYKLAPNEHTCQDIDECAENTDDCDHTCINTVGSFKCQCDHGFQLDVDDRGCKDINECAADSSLCEDDCENTVANVRGGPVGYKCLCNAGSELMPNGKNCQDRDECKDKSHDCSQICVNTDPFFKCDCKKGYNLGIDNKTCIDINECSGKHGCQQVCVNIPESYECKCHHGFSLLKDGKKCQLNRECTPGKSKCGAGKCRPKTQKKRPPINASWSYEERDSECVCDQGYTWDSGISSCVDIDECLDACGPHGNCTNTVGSFKCECKEGFTYDEDTHSCQKPVKRLPCKAKMDIQILVDSSLSVGEDNFHEMMKNIADNLVGALDISPTKTRLALMKYSTEATPEVLLTDPLQGSKKALQDKVQSISYQPGSTYTGKALDDALMYFKQQQRTSQDVGKVCFVFTDGVANDRNRVKDAGKNWRDAGIDIYAIGIGNTWKNLYYRQGLIDLAGDKKKTRKIDDFSGVAKLVTDQLLSDICKARKGPKR